MPSIIESEQGGFSNYSTLIFHPVPSRPIPFCDAAEDTDTDTDNLELPCTRRWAWYCKDRACPKYYAAWLCKTNFLLHLRDTLVHREDPATRTRDGRRELAKAWRVETAFDMSEPKQMPPRE